ncbi:hypothetical protein V6N13_094972 [Hibiscus sabdariffa]|uniref:DUF4408 domain-containing protein n=1 Tax=Hibiscus sabdariffa TaxID=183260 RepID=A0ABR2PT42_9ROSI
MLEEPISTVPCSIWTSILSWFTPTVFFVFLNLTIGTIYFTSTLSSNRNGGDGQTQEQENETNPKLVRSPSVLQRLKSVNFYAYRSQEPVVSYEKTPDLSDFQFSFQHQISPQQQLDRSPSLLQRVKSINLKSYFSPEKIHYEPADEVAEVDYSNAAEPEAAQADGRTLDEIYSQLKGGENHHVTRTKSDTKPASGEVPTKLPRKIKKSASVKSAFRHFEEDDIVETRRPATVREGKHKATAEDEENEEDNEVDARADDFINKFKQQLKLQKLDSIIRYKEMINRGNGN